jgi:hypothetical protein
VKYACQCEPAVGVKQAVLGDIYGFICEGLGLLVAMFEPKVTVHELKEDLRSYVVRSKSCGGGSGA